MVSSRKPGLARNSRPMIYVCARFSRLNCLKLNQCALISCGLAVTNLRDHARLWSREKSRLARLVSREVPFSQKPHRDLARRNSTKEVRQYIAVLVKMLMWWQRWERVDVVAALVRSMLFCDPLDIKSAPVYKLRNKQISTLEAQVFKL